MKTQTTTDYQPQALTTSRHLANWVKPILVGCFWIWLVPSPSHADVTTVEPRNAGGNYVFKLSVTPAAEPNPAFRYRLLIEPEKTIPGNAITHYLRSLGENSLNGPWTKAENEFGREIHRWYDIDTPESDVPLDGLKTVYGYFDSYVENHLRRATLCREADWGLALEDLRGPETIEFLLPSVQQTRQMARTLSIRARYEILTGDYEKAIKTIGMNYQLGHNVNEMGMLVASLVGIANVGIANYNAMWFIGAKKSPNLYWALAELPRPIVSTRESLRLERSFATRFFPEAANLESANHSKEGWNQLLEKFLRQLEKVSRNQYGRLWDSENSSAIKTQTETMGFALSSFSDAKKRLVERGMEKSEVDKMCVAQVILIDGIRDYQYFMGQYEKSYYLPIDQLNRFKTQPYFDIREKSKTRLGARIALIFSPSITQVRYAEARIQATVNSLMAIESIRHHLATENGEFPKSLSDLELPVPNDPFTNKPLAYSLEGDTAVIEHSMTSGKSKFRYEIRLAK